MTIERNFTLGISAPGRRVTVAIQLGPVNTLPHIAERSAAAAPLITGWAVQAIMLVRDPVTFLAWRRHIHLPEGAPPHRRIAHGAVPCAQWLSLRIQCRHAKFLEAIPSMTHNHSSVAVFHANPPAEVAIRSSVAIVFLALEGAAMTSGLVAVAGALACIGVPHDRVLRYEKNLKAEALRERRTTRVEVDASKVEGLDSQDDCEPIVAMARRDGRTNVGCIVLGRGENKQHFRAWLAAAAGVFGFIGFTVRRAIFREPLLALRDNNVTCEATVAEIAQPYRQWPDILEFPKIATSCSANASATGLARPLEG